MNPRCAFLLFLIIISALMVGGCVLQPPTPQTVDAEFTLKTEMVDGRMVFVGVGGEVDGVVNPTLTARQGDIIRIVIINGDGIPHDFSIPDLNVHTQMMTGRDMSVEAVFEITQSGSYAYFCTVSGHRQMGMEGKVIVSPLEE